jgi:hypothetical protein
MFALMMLLGGFSAPEIEVPGVLLSPTGNRAIIRSPKNQHLIEVGDQLGDYRVHSIGARGVVFAFKKYRFFMPIRR